MNANGRDIFTDPAFADHRAPMTRGQAFRNGVIAGIIMGVTLAGAALVIFSIL